MTETARADSAPAAPAAMPLVRLKPGGHRRARAGHPWLYSNEIDMTPALKALPPGTAARFEDAHGEALGAGFFNPHSLIAGRLMARPGAAVDRASIAERLAAALNLRERLYDAPFYRLVHAEADGLPGLIVDRFGPVAAVQFNAAGMERLEAEILGALGDVIAPAHVLVRSDGAAREAEGLAGETHWALGGPLETVEVVEGGVRFLADPEGGQKTGWFYDHRHNRALVAGLSGGARMLDLYCYLGGFGLQAAASGAESVTLVDRSQPALDLAARAAETNGLADRCVFARNNAFDEAGRLANTGERFDIVVADPPAFVKSRKDKGAGARGYRKLTRLAATLVRPGGFVFLASCSFHLDAEAFDDQIRRGLVDARRTGRILYAGGAGPDHPVHPHLPETSYLKHRLLQLD
ncbi:MAG: methyltransferase domain-containing protein [Alphaproteobacteria bacterium]|nr:methyltransferase domain-containing protein [Alphaproteobacteria bacterium]